MKKEAILLFTIVFSVVVLAAPGQTPGHFTYFLHVPPSSDECYLYAVGWSDNTKVEVYELTPDGSQKLITTDTVNRMEVKTLVTFKKRESDGWFIKVIASNRLGILLDDRDEAATLYPSVDGFLVGKEFIIYGVKGRVEVNMQGSTIIYAYEDAKVTLYDSKGGVIKEYKLIQNQSVLLPAIGHPQPCRVVSTGRIMVATWGANSLTALVDAKSRLKGRWFAGFSFLDEGYLIVIPYEACKVYVYDESGKLIGSKELTEGDIAVGTPWIFNSSTPGTLRVVSTGNISVFSGQYGFGDDFTVVSVPGNFEMAFYLPPTIPAYAVVFSDRPVDITIDGYPAFSLSGDDYGILISRKEMAYWFNASREQGLVRFIGPMVHRIMANGPVVLAIYYYGGWDDWGSYAVALEDAGRELPDPKPSKGVANEGGGINLGEIALYGVGAAIIAIMAVIVLILVKRMPK